MTTTRRTRRGVALGGLLVVLIGGMVSPAAAGPVGRPDAAALSAAAALDDPGPRGRDRDLAALRMLRDRQEDAWARGDGAAYAAIHTPDADVVTFSGDHLRTRAGIEEGMQYFFDTYLAGTRIVTLTERVRIAEPDVAVIVRTGCVLWPGQTECTDDALSINTNIAVRRHGAWWYESFQNTRVRPLLPAGDTGAGARAG